MSSHPPGPGCRTCTECLRSLPTDQFHRNNKTGRASRCRECTNAARRAAYAADPQRQKDANNRWRAQNRDKVHAYQERYRERLDPARIRDYNVWYYQTVTIPKRESQRADTPDDRPHNP